MNTAKLQALAAEIEALSPPARIRLAADLLEQRQPQLAHTILEQCTADLGVALALDLMDRVGGRT